MGGEDVEGGGKSRAQLTRQAQDAIEQLSYNLAKYQERAEPNPRYVDQQSARIQALADYFQDTERRLQAVQGEPLDRPPQPYYRDPQQDHIEAIDLLNIIQLGEQLSLDSGRPPDWGEAVRRWMTQHLSNRLISLIEYAEAIDPGGLALFSALADTLATLIKRAHHVRVKAGPQQPPTDRPKRKGRSQ